MLPAQVLICGDEDACLAVEDLVDELPDAHTSHSDPVTPASSPRRSNTGLEATAGMHRSGGPHERCKMESAQQAGCKRCALA
jgi:hypothetical protein